MPAARSQDKWNPQEGEAANIIVHRLLDQGLDPEKDLFIVSPFVDVVTGLKRTLCQAVPRKRTGTVHTTQGKEADVVLFVLGAGGDRPGPRDWAAKSPNLLNVAVSRAKRRLFVIGDHAAWKWKKHEHFDVLARAMYPLTQEECEWMQDAAPASAPGACRCPINGAF